LGAIVSGGGAPFISTIIAIGLALARTLTIGYLYIHMAVGVGILSYEQEIYIKGKFSKNRSKAKVLTKGGGCLLLNGSGTVAGGAVGTPLSNR
jgi:hypothetical protein